MWLRRTFTFARLALRVGRGASELHDRMMVGLRVQRIDGLSATSCASQLFKSARMSALIIAHGCCSFRLLKVVEFQG
jgi:hypothetical protein